MFFLTQLNVMNSSRTILPFFHTMVTHYTDYFCIFWFITCVHHTCYMKDKWILPLTLCESTWNLVHTLMYKHFFLKAVFPKLVKLVQFPLCYTCQSFDLYHLNISGLQLFCILFPTLLYTLSQTTFYILHLNSCIHINKTDHHAIDFQWYQHVSWCSYVHMYILILIRIVLDILYLYIQHTIILHLQYCRHINFKNNRWHHIVSNKIHTVFNLLLMFQQ